MFRRQSSRTLALCFALLLTAQAAMAAPRPADATAGSARAFAALLWQTLAGAWSEAGCWFDPYGGCGTTQAPEPPANSDAGCWLDPHGGCGADQAPAPQDQADEGCYIDPHGGCGAR